MFPRLTRMRKHYNERQGNLLTKYENEISWLKQCLQGEENAHRGNMHRLTAMARVFGWWAEFELERYPSIPQDDNGFQLWNRAPGKKVEKWDRVLYQKRKGSEDG